MTINWLGGLIMHLSFALITSVIATMGILTSIANGHYTLLWAGLINAVATIWLLAVTFNIGTNWTNDLILSRR